MRQENTVLSFSLGHMLFQMLLLFHFMCQRVSEVDVPHFTDEDQRHRDLPKVTQPVRGEANLESAMLLCLIVWHG